MDYSYVTTKGQIVIPVKIRRHLGIKPGTKVCFIERDGEIIFQPVTKEYLRSLCGIIKAEHKTTTQLINDRKKDENRGESPS